MTLCRLSPEGGDTRLCLSAVAALGELSYTDDLASIAKDISIASAIRGAAARAMAKAGAAAAVLELLAGPADGTEEQAEVWYGACAGLGERQHSAELKGVLTGTAWSSLARLCAAEVLAAFGSTSSAEREFARLAEATTEPGWLRVRAALALGRVGREADAGKLAEEVTRGGQVPPRWRLIAATRLGEWGLLQAAGAIASGLATDRGIEAGWRCKAAECLLRLARTEEAEATLRAIATDPSQDVAWRLESLRILCAIRRIGGVAEVAQLMLRDGAGEYEIGVIQLLAMLGDKEAVASAARQALAARKLPAGDRLALAKYLAGAGQSGPAQEVWRSVLADPGTPADLGVAAAAALHKVEPSESLLKTIAALIPACEPEMKLKAAVAFQNEWRREELSEVRSAVVFDPRVPYADRVRLCLHIEDEARYADVVPDLLQLADVGEPGEDDLENVVRALQQQGVEYCGPYRHVGLRGLQGLPVSMFVSDDAPPEVEQMMMQHLNMEENYYGELTGDYPVAYLTRPCDTTSDQIDKLVSDPEKPW